MRRSTRGWWLFLVAIAAVVALGVVRSAYSQCSIIVTKASDQGPMFEAFGWPLGELLASGPIGLTPAGIAFLPGGDFVVWVQNDGPLLRFDGATFELVGEVIAKNAGGGIQGRDVAITPWGEYFIAGGSSDSILTFDAQDGSFTGPLFPPGTGGLDTAWGMALTVEDHLLVASAGTHEVLRFDAHTGDFLGIFVKAGDGGLVEPYDLVVGPDGDLYVCSRALGAVFRYDGTTGKSKGEFATIGGSSARGVAFAPNGDLLVCSWEGPEGGAAYRFDPEGKPLGAFARSGAAMFLAVAPACECYADCDGSGALDIFDFLCFLNLFHLGDAGADCDGDAGLDLFDFLCYTNAFNGGC
jgi:DNA-binding beta-propeller fold protein YncE